MMNDDKTDWLERMVREAGWNGIYTEWVSPTERKSMTIPVTPEQVVKFAELVAAAEREAWRIPVMEMQEAVIESADQLGAWVPCAARTPIPAESSSGYFWCWNENTPDRSPELLEVYGDYHKSPSRGFYHEACGIVSWVTHWMPVEPPAQPHTSEPKPDPQK